MMRFSVLLAGLMLILSGCASPSPRPEPDDVKLAHDAANPKCKRIGPISGTTLTALGTTDDALKDLRKEAANKGANYVVLGEFSSYGTTVTGDAYWCP
jgi:hypothetical protein